MLKNRINYYILILTQAPGEAIVPENQDISVYYVPNEKIYNLMVDDVFFFLSLYITSDIIILI